ncbi:endonuclease domain-containing protein, partial [Micromonospora tarensis]
MKTCTECQQTKPVDDFYRIKTRNNTPSSRCKGCLRTDALRRHYRNKGRKYGLTQQQYDDLMKAAGHRCQLCGADRDLVIDHCHTSKDVRGVLCRTCNTGLGMFRDN